MAAPPRFNFAASARAKDRGTKGAEKWTTSVRPSGARGNTPTSICGGGMSFGAWVAMTVGADEPAASTLIGIAPPVSRLISSPWSDKPSSSSRAMVELVR